MGLPKFIPEKVFRLIGTVIILIYVYFIASSVINDSGPYGFISKKIADEHGVYNSQIALLFTLLVTLPFIMIIPVLRAFSKVKPISEEIKEGPVLKYIWGSAMAASFEKSLAHEVYSNSLRWRRFLAFIIDRSIALFGGVIIFIPLVILKEAVPSLTEPVLITAIGWLLIVAFYAWARDFYQGQSLGRRLLHLKVVDVETGATIGAWRSFKRELLLHLAPFIMIELFFLFVSKDGRRLGDMWSKTKVIDA